MDPKAHAVGCSGEGVRVGGGDIVYLDQCIHSVLFANSSVCTAYAWQLQALENDIPLED